jgi:hypothetical protein
LNEKEVAHGIAVPYFFDGAYFFLLFEKEFCGGRSNRNNRTRFNSGSKICCRILDCLFIKANVLLVMVMMARQELPEQQICKQVN